MYVRSYHVRLHPLRHVVHIDAVLQNTMCWPIDPIISVQLVLYAFDKLIFSKPFYIA